MKAYENGTPAYFATPPVNLIRAFHTSLTQITKANISLEERFQLHRDAAKRVRSAAADLGLKLVPVDPACTANGMTAVSSQFSPKVSAYGTQLNSDLLAGRPRGRRSCSSIGQERSCNYWRYSQGKQGYDIYLQVLSLAQPFSRR